MLFFLPHPAVRCSRFGSHFEAPKDFSYFYSLLLIYSIGKGFKMEKIIVGRFLFGRPSSSPNPTHFHARAGLPPVSRATVTGRRGSPVGAVFPQSPLCSAPRVSSPANFPLSSRPHVDCLHHPTVHLPS
jgi:hypothetical protein